MGVNNSSEGHTSTDTINFSVPGEGPPELLKSDDPKIQACPAGSKKINSPVSKKGKKKRTDAENLRY